MNHHHPPPPPPPPPPPQTPFPPIIHHTAAQILISASKLLLHHLPLFLPLSLLLLSFHFNLLYLHHHLSSSLHTNTSLHHHHHPRLRRRPFLHLRRFGTLDNNFFNSASEFDHPLLNPKPNSSFIIISNFDPDFGFSYPISDNGVVLNKIVRNGLFSFKPPFDLFDLINRKGADFVSNSSVSDDDEIKFGFLLGGLRLNRRDFVTLLYFAGFLAVGYVYTVLTYLAIYTMVYGIVFVGVIDHVLGRYSSVYRTVSDGAVLGLRRLSGFVLMRWAVTDALGQVVGIYFFGEVEDQFALIKIFVMTKLMPFADVSVSVKGYERESKGYMLAWFFVELVVGFVFAVDAWVAIVEWRRSGRVIIRKGCRMLGTLLLPSLVIGCWEVIACRVFPRWLLKETYGELFALAFQSVMEVYFMVVWLVFYLAARHRNALSMGRIFGRREVERLLEPVR
ncbi:hypothetical protein LIER_11329 [Lithospermum erythrorhizon]|uniref:Transmembrane protein n=1 Tax=Lithospermum erythrorhizon TaxID=34254 RepID=A0AAV3PP73_LITER